MIRFRLRELMAERQFQEGRLITVNEISSATGIHRITLSRILNKRGYNTHTYILDLLCTYFKCRIEQLIEHVPDDHSD